MKNIAIFGGATIDTKWRAQENLEQLSSSLGQKNEYFGGVARNIAEGLAHMKISPTFISRVGNDSAGKRIIEHLDVLGVNTKYVSLSERYPTANYCAFFHESGHLYSAMIDVNIYTEYNQPYCRQLLHSLSQTDLCVLDTDLPSEILKFFCTQYHGELWVTLTSINATKKIRPLLSHIDVLFLNLAELTSLMHGDSLKQIWQALHEQGLAAIVVTLGADGAFVANGTGSRFYAAKKTSIVDVTGAGDATCAGFIAAYSLGIPFHDCLEFGMQAAHLTLQTASSVSDELIAIRGMIDERNSQTIKRSGLCA